MTSPQSIVSSQTVRRGHDLMLDAARRHRGRGPTANLVAAIVLFSVNPQPLHWRRLSRFSRCRALASSLPARDSQSRLDIRERKRRSPGSAQPDHSPELLGACQPEVFRIVVFDPNQHSARPPSPGNHNAFALSAGKDRVQVVLQFFFRDVTHTTSSIASSRTTISYAIHPEYIVRAFPNREHADYPPATAPNGFDIGWHASDFGSHQGLPRVSTWGSRPKAILHRRFAAGQAS
jgi:hypothetical protein